MTGRRTTKVAIIGSGLAGLTAAYRLSTAQIYGLDFEVHIFEKAESLGMDAHSVSIPVSTTDDEKGQREWRVDVPMRSFQGGYYPQLIMLYKHLGVQFRQADFSYSFSTLGFRSKHERYISTDMIYNGASGRAGVSMPSSILRTERKLHPSSPSLAYIDAFALFVFNTMILLGNYIRLSILSAPIFRPPADLTFDQWAQRTTPKSKLAKAIGLNWMWAHFCYGTLVPLFSAVCTAPQQDIFKHPVAELLDYIWLTLFTHHYVVVKGVRDVVSRLSRPVTHIHVSSPITTILPDNEPGKVSIITGDGKTSYSGISHVIFATQANGADPILSSYLSSLPKTSRQRKRVEDLINCLRRFTYRPNIVVNHSDDSLLPDNHEDRRDLNLVTGLHDGECWPLPSNPTGPYIDASYAMATHILPRPFAMPPEVPPLYQTTNPIAPPRQEHIKSVSRMERAVLTVDGKNALQGLATEERRLWQSYGRGRMRIGPLQGAGRLQDSSLPGIWVCGAYAHGGIPLLEGCIVSAKNIVDQGILVSEGVGSTRFSW